MITLTNMDVMKLIELHAALQQKKPPRELLRLERPFANLTAIEMLAKIVGLPLVAFDFPPPSFAERFPKGAILDDAKVIFGNDLKKYRVWRNLILDCQILAMPGQVDPDPWDSLRRITRLTLGKSAVNSLYNLAAALPPDVTPGQITRAVALDAEARLTAKCCADFRSNFGVFDRLQDQRLIVATGLLPDAPIGFLPRPTAHTTHAPLPPKLQTFFDTASTPARAALPFVWRIACLSGLFEPTDDPQPGDLVAPTILERLQVVDPAELGFQRPTRNSFHIYLRNLRKDLSPKSTQPICASVDPVDEAWAALRDALRGAGASKAQITYLSHISAPARAEGLGPSDLSHAWFQRTLDALPTNRRAPFRSACYFLDEQRCNPNVHDTLLSPEATGIERVRAVSEAVKAEPVPARTKHPVSDDPVEAAWLDFFARARAGGAAENRLHGLYKLKKFAILNGLEPKMLTHKWVEETRDSARRDASKISTAARFMDDLRTFPGLTHLLPEHPLGKLTDRRRSAVDVSPDISRELEDLLDRQGVTNSTRRTARISVAALVEATAAKGDGLLTLEAALSCEFTAIDWDGHRGHAERYTQVLKRLRDFQQLPWTPAWSALQRAVVTAGITARENPVSGLLIYAEGREPRGLTWAWARSVDRRLRTPNALSRHGRADLAKTFAANIARLDRLHDFPDIVATNLLPIIIGAVRR